MFGDAKILGAAESALRAFASAGADEHSRIQYARSLRQTVLSALVRHLQVSASGSAVDALRLLWASSLPRPDLINALLSAPSASTLVSELDVLFRKAEHLGTLTACAAAACHHSSKLAPKVLLACARAVHCRPEPRARGATVRIVVAVVHLLVDSAVNPADGVLALADAGFAAQAAAPAIRRARQLVTYGDPSPPLFHALLLLLPRLSPGNDRANIATAAADLSKCARGPAARACVLALQSAAAESSAIADAVLSLYERSLEQVEGKLVHVTEKDRCEQNQESYVEPPAVRQISTMDVAFVYALLAQESVKKRCLALLHALCDAPANLFSPVASAAGSSSAMAPPRDPPGERARSRALLEALAVPGVEEHTAMVADVCDSLARAPGAAARSWAARVLSALFRKHPSARERILHHIFSALEHGTDGERDAPTTYISLLNELSQLPDSAPLFRVHVPILEHWLGFLPAMPFDAAVAVVAALGRIAATLPALYDRLLLYLRKLSAARARVSRFLALHGLVALAATPTVPAPLFKEIAALLSTALARARDTRVPALKLLAGAVRSATPSARTMRWLPLNKAVLNSLTKIAGSADVGEPGTFVRLVDCFAPCCGGVAGLREAPLLLSYALELCNEFPPAKLLCVATEAHISDARGAFASACVPPPLASSAAEAKWVSARVAMLIALCEVFLHSDRSPLPRVLPVYALSFIARDAVPPAWRARPSHDRSCPSASGGHTARGTTGSALDSISARERCAHDSLATSKKFAELEAAGVIFGTCTLSLEECLRVLQCIEGVEDSVGRYAASVLRSEVLFRVEQLFSGRGDALVESFGDVVIRAAKKAFVDTNPNRVDECMPHKTPENAKSKSVIQREVQKRTRKLSQGGSTQSLSRPKPVRKRGHAPGPPPEVHLWKRKQKRRRGTAVPESPVWSSSTSSMLGSSIEDFVNEKFPDPDSFGQAEQALQKVQYEPVREALARALANRGLDCESALCSTRSSAVKLLLRGMSLDFDPLQWGFLVGNEGTNATALVCARELVTLFELDFQRSMSNVLALDYLELLSRFIHSSKKESESDACGIRRFLAETSSRILKEYSISQIRIVRSLFVLLLSSLDDNIAIEVVQQVVEWLGAQQGVLDSQFKSEGENVRLSYDTYDHDILEEAYTLDRMMRESESSKAVDCGSGEDSERHSKEDNTSRKVVAGSTKRMRSSDGTTSLENANTETGDDIKSSSVTLLPNGTKVKELGLNDTEESCLLCIQAALQRLDEAVPSGDALRLIHTQDADDLLADLDRLTQCTNAFRALLSTQMPGARGRVRITWARPLVRRAAETLWRLRSTASSALEGARREMRNADCTLDAAHFGAVFSACALVLRATLGEDGAARAARALCAAEGTACARARRAGARLELDAAAAVAELERHCATDGVVENLKSAYREIVGCNAADTGGDIVATKARRKRRMRSRNRVIDCALEDENGDDDFADLEDFLVGFDETDL